MKNITQKQAADILQKDLDISKEWGGKEKQWNDYMAASHKILEECNYLISTCIKYMNAPDDGGRGAPISAWKGAIPNQHEANRATEVLTELMKDAKAYLLDELQLRNEYDALTAKVAETINAIFDLFKKLNGQKVNEQIHLDDKPPLPTLVPTWAK